MPQPSLGPGFFKTPFATAKGHEGGRLRSQSNQENDRGKNGERESSMGWEGGGLPVTSGYTWIFFFLGDKAQFFTQVYR